MNSKLTAACANDASLAEGLAMHEEAKEEAHLGRLCAPTCEGCCVGYRDESLEDQRGYDRDEDIFDCMYADTIPDGAPLA